MEFDDVARALAGVPHILPERGRELYDFVLREQPREVIELGFAHGTSSCYIAAALDELGTGRITTLDSTLALQRTPPLSTLLERTGLGSYVRPIHAERTYTWELRKLLRDGERFDFAFIDGAHTWEVDGFAFLLVDRMLDPGSWVLFDDLDWTIDSSATLRDKPEMRLLPEEERTTPQVREVFELLVRANPDYAEEREEGEWAWARKRPSGAPPQQAAWTPSSQPVHVLERRLRDMESSTAWRVGRAITAVPRALKQRAKG